MRNTKDLSEDEIRKKIDGFSLESKGNTTDNNSYITTDLGVYFTPDYALEDTKNKKEIIKGRIKGTSAFNIDQADEIDDISWSNNNFDHSKLNNKINEKK